jgi:hypothetical protein
MNSNTYLSTAQGPSLAPPGNTLIDIVPAGTLGNVCQTLSMLACLSLEDLSKHSAMGVFHTLNACEDALLFEINRIKSNSEGTQS